MNSKEEIERLEYLKHQRAWLDEVTQTWTLFDYDYAAKLETEIKEIENKLKGENRNVCKD